MNVVLPLAALFAGIILVGTTAVFLHDLLERRWLDRSIRSRGGGRGGMPVASVYRGTAPFGEGRMATRGGQVVWVRAGSHSSDGTRGEQRVSEPRPATGTTTRVTAR